MPPPAIYDTTALTMPTNHHNCTPNKTVIFLLNQTNKSLAKEQDLYTYFKQENNLITTNLSLINIKVIQSLKIEREWAMGIDLQSNNIKFLRIFLLRQKNSWITIWDILVYCPIGEVMKIMLAVRVIIIWKNMRNLAIVWRKKQSIMLWHRVRFYLGGSISRKITKYMSSIQK